MADIGLDASSASAALVEAADVAAWLPTRATETHKWRSACWVVAGSLGDDRRRPPGDARGAAGWAPATCACRTPGRRPTIHRLRSRRSDCRCRERGWADAVLEGVERFGRWSSGPAWVSPSPRRPRSASSSRRRPCRLVVDGDGLTALGTDAARAAGRARQRRRPHAARRRVRAPGRRAAVGATASPPTRDLAGRLGAVVLLKGPTTVVAAPDGRVLLTPPATPAWPPRAPATCCRESSAPCWLRVLSRLEAAAAGAYIHGRAGRLGWRRGLVAGDLPDLLPAAIEELE